MPAAHSLIAKVATVKPKERLLQWSEELNTPRVPLWVILSNHHRWQAVGNDLQQLTTPLAKQPRDLGGYSYAFNHTRPMLFTSQGQTNGWLHESWSGSRTTTSFPSFVKRRCLTTNAVPPVVTLQGGNDATAADETWLSLAIFKATQSKVVRGWKDVGQYQQIKLELSVRNAVIENPHKSSWTVKWLCYLTVVTRGLRGRSFFCEIEIHPDGRSSLRAAYVESGINFFERE